MNEKIIKVFYGADCLPYKDKELSVHYPIIGGAFQGASQVNEIKFYIDNIVLDDYTGVWVAVSKLPNGQVGYNRLTIDSDSDGHFVKLSLTRWHTQFKGDLYVNLQCYDGGIELVENEQNVFVPTGVPVIQVTGSVKVPIVYATGIVSGEDVQVQTLQDIWAYFAEYLRLDSNLYFKVIDDIGNINESSYEGIFKTGDIVYSSGSSNPFHSKRFYKITVGTYPELSYEEIEDIKLRYPSMTSAELYGTTTIHGNYNDLIFYGQTYPTIPLYVAHELESYVTLATNQSISGEKTFESANIYALTITGYIIPSGDDIDLGVSEGSFFRNLYMTGKIYNGGTYGLSLPNTTSWESDQTIATQDYVEDIVSTVKANEFQVVEELPQEGEEGIIYLVPITGGSGYTQYIWEGSDYVSLGTTEIDLSGYYTSDQIDTMLESYVPTSRTIAGINLQNNISAQDLTDALVFANNTDIDNLFA